MSADTRPVWRKQVTGFHAYEATWYARKHGWRLWVDQRTLAGVPRFTASIERWRNGRIDGDALRWLPTLDAAQRAAEHYAEHGRWPEGA